MPQSMECLLEKTREFLARAEPSRLPVLESVARNIQRRNFRICIAGGFSRGKSHFLNQLLNCRLLPESAVPTTACLTEIIYGAAPRLVAVGRAGEEELPLDALQDFSQAPAKPLPDVELRVFYPSPFLESGIALLDTPGVEDTIAQSAEIAHAALENADAAIIMVSAIAPFSLTERAFIKTYMQDRSIPLLAGCISFLDQVAPEAVAKQLDFIRSKCSALYPDMALLCPDCRGADETGLVCGLANIRQFLLDWARLPRLEALRRKMVLDRLGLLLQGCIRSLECKKELLAGDLQGSRRELDSAIAALDDRQDVCEELKIWFLTRKESLEDKIRKMSRAWSNALIHEIGGREDPEEFILTSFDKFYQETCEYARVNLEKSIAGLSRKMAEIYGAPLVMAPWEDFPSSIPIALTRKEKNGAGLPVNLVVDEIFRQGELILDRFVARMPGVGIIWSNLRPFAHELLQKARNFIVGGCREKPAFEKQVSTICSRMNMSFQDEIDRIYRQVFEALRANRLAWLAARKRELEQYSTVEEKSAQLAKLTADLARAGELLAEVRDGRGGCPE